MQAEHYNGLIAVWKEQGYTSHDVVAKLRGILHQKKIGHTGTLDPQAQGVLAVGLGLGTKTVDLLPDHWKTYEAEVTFGVQTDTEDIWGNVLKTHDVSKTPEEIIQAICSFGGTYDQIPPMYSAKKIDGKKLYQKGSTSHVKGYSGFICKRQQGTFYCHLLCRNIYSYTLCRYRKKAWL